MTLDRFRKRFNAARRAVDGEGRLTTEFSQLIDELLRSFDSNSDTTNVDVAAVDATATAAQTSASAAQAQADLSGHQGTGDGMTWHTDATGLQPPAFDTRDLIARFTDESGTEIATRTVRGTYLQASDTISLSDVSSTGEATTVVFQNNLTESVRAVVTHTNSQAVAILTWSFLDETIAGTVPVTGGGK